MTNTPKAIFYTFLCIALWALIPVFSKLGQTELDTSFALFSVLSKNVKLAPCPLITIFYLTATVCSLISMLLLSGFSWPTVGSLIPILVNGLFLNGFSYIFWIKALSLAEASYIAPLMFFTPVLAAIYLIMFFHEPFLPVYGIGLFVVVIGGLLNRENNRTERCMPSCLRECFSPSSDDEST
jgi:drug/metabolite transporter (DMT)-like permease